MHKLLSVGATLLVAISAASDLAAQRDWYVSATRGKGKKGTIEKPAKDLGNIVKKLSPGDTIYIAAGTYVGRGESGHDKIVVPVRIMGGYSDDFKTRDPFGAHQTVMTGKNVTKNFAGRARLEILCNRVRDGAEFPIVVDGVIVDNGPRNQYGGKSGMVLKRRYLPATQSNASPDSPGIAIWGHTGGRVVVQNSIIMNCGPTGRRGWLEVKGVKGSDVTIRNNLVVNNTSGIAALSAWHGTGDDVPKFTVENNTVLFTWKYDPIATHGGDCFRTEKVLATLTNNVFGYGDYYGINNQSGGDLENLTLVNNAFCGNLMADYLEFDTKMAVADMEDEADKLSDAEDNVQVKLTGLKVNEDWAKNYATRNVIDRMKAEESVQALGSFTNDLRSMLGLPLQGGTLDVGSDVWVHRFALEDAVRIARTAIDGRGCRMPAADTAAMPIK